MSNADWESDTKSEQESDDEEDDEEEDDEEDDDYTEDQTEDDSEVDAPPSDDEEEDDEDDDEEDEEEDDEDDDEYETDDNTQGEGFQDEPGGYDENQPVNEEFYDEREPEEEEEKEEGGRKRAVLCAIILCCCIFLLAIIGLIVGLVVFGKDDDGNNGNKGSPSAPSDGSSPSVPTTPQVFPTLSPAFVSPSAKPPPTKFPTKSPTPTQAPIIIPTAKPTPFPTGAPTASAEPTQSVPDELELIPFADTSIYIDGFFDQEAFGTEDTFLVQNGPEFVKEIPTAYGLIGFDLSEVPSLDRLEGRNLTAILQLTHVPSIVARGAATLTVVLLPSTRMDIETLHNGVYAPVGGTDGPTFDVAPADDVLQVDISSLVFGGQPLEMNQVFLMIENRGIEQPEGSEGDRFRTRESDSPPKLFLGFLPSGPPTTEAPSQSPQPSPPPSTAAPSISLLPSLAPSTAAPSSSLKPTAVASAAPSGLGLTNTTLNTRDPFNSTLNNTTENNSTAAPSIAPPNTTLG
jgi:hypothetical protein